MFLLNSRAPLVTETCSAKSRHPFYRRYGASLPSSLGWIAPTRLRLLTQGHLCQILVRAQGILSSSLFTDPGAQPKPPCGSPFAHSPGSPRYETPQVSMLGWDDDPTRPTSRCRELDSRCRMYPYGTGILTRFPFGRVGLRAPLGPTNPQLMIVAEETLPFRRTGFSPVFAATTGGILNPERSRRRYRLPSTRTRRLSTRYPCGSPRYRWPT